MNSKASRKSTQPIGPKCAEEIAEKILHYGAFQDGLDFLSAMLKSKASTSIIIRGSAGVGKVTLVREALARNDVISVWLLPSHYKEDYTALRHIAAELHLTARLTLSEMLLDLEERCLGTDKKIVIVLSNFEEFCRERQSLLYNLTTLTQHGDNISLIGLTYSMGCTENLEKRVRSRINASFYFLKPPYRSYDEYLEFASLLLGGHKLDDSLKDELYMMYSIGKRSIRALKRVLVQSFEWKSGRLVLGEISNVNKVGMSPLDRRIRSLTTSQCKLLCMIMYFYSQEPKATFKLVELSIFARKRSLKNFTSIDHLTIKNASYLVSNSLLVHTKHSEMIDQFSTLFVNVMPAEVKDVMRRHPELNPNRGPEDVLKKIKG